MFLEAALSFEPPQSLRQVAATIGYDPGDISRFFPDSGESDKTAIDALFY
jgi:hypothetical protein